LEQNPTTRVEIQGHVNGPNTKRNTKEFIELSTSRARTVRDFLLVNEIEDERVVFAGMGNAYMLFPDPKSESESEANRRVEVHVVSK
jgi:outer membrane protein OmpA-like peptidoglycan-associated protein